MKIIPRSSKQRFESGKPGLYAGVPEAVYHGFDACSNSRLNVVHDRSAKHCRYEIDNPSARTDAMNDGYAYHLAVLEEERFHEEVHVLKDLCEARTQKGAACTYVPKLIDKDSGKHYCGVHGKKSEPLTDILLLSSAAMFHVREAARATLADPDAKELLSEHLNEVSMLWTLGKLLCKGRIDSWYSPLETIVDLKKTVDASPDAFPRTIDKYGYHRQAAMYLEGMRKHGVEVKHYTIIAQEFAPPYGTAVYRLDEPTLNAGKKDLIRPLIQYQEAVQSGVWPGYPNGVQDISLPPWALRRIFSS